VEPGPALSLVERVYEALAAGDRGVLEEALAPDFVGRLADGMPVGGGVHDGAAAMIDDGWWPIGRAFRARAFPDELIVCDGDRVLVTGRYRGDGVDAAFMHLWTVRGGRVVALTQVTDTARWGSA
jgi:2-(1,2-epoxy-1,2-dihydrophenyl)acetyl-CoA isomerase